MSLYPFVLEMKNMLQNLDHWLGKAADHAKAKGFDPNILVQSRLAPDQYPLARQVQSACDSAKFVASRLTGKEAPAHVDDETTLDQLRARIVKATAYLGTFVEKDFEGAETRKIALPFLGPAKGAVGLGYFINFGQPNFFFHVTTAYAILRNNGVDVGKRDFIGDHMSLIDL
jgi:uncharacterized protein